MLGGGAVALISSSAGAEWVAYRAVEDVGGVVHVRDVLRGIYDTPPLSHPAGATVWFASTGYGVENEGTPYLTPTSVYLKMLPYTVRGVLSPASATPLTVDTDMRASRPFPPGRIRVNGVNPAAQGPASGTLSLSWAHRSRLHQGVSSQDDDSVTPETGTTYSVKAYRADTNALLAEGTGNGLTASAALAYTGLVRFEIRSALDDLSSLRAQTFTISYTGSGAANSITVDSTSYVLDGGGP